MRAANRKTWTKPWIAWRQTQEYANIVRELNCKDSQAKYLQFGLQALHQLPVGYVPPDFIGTSTRMRIRVTS